MRKLNNSIRNNEQTIFTEPDEVLGSSQPRAPTKLNPEQDTNEEQVFKLAQKSSEVLFKTQTVFPFDFFPDTLTINANKIDVVSGVFFLSNQTTSIPLRDVANVQVQTSPFFATLRIVNIRYPMQPLTLNYLKKSEAIKAKNIIDGLIVATVQGADVAAIEPKNLLRQIEKVGESGAPE